MTKSNPSVSVVILSFNRVNELCKTIEKLYNQEYHDIEVIVVDNASADGTADTIVKKYPSVKLIALSQNIGVAGMNRGLSIASGECILLLDDDSYPVNGTIAAGVNAFRTDPLLGIVAFKIFNTRINKTETEYFNHPAKYFIGCGAMVSAKLFSSIGYYNESYFLYYNELDLSARCLNAGFTIRYLEDNIVVHDQSVNSRGSGKGDPFTSEHHYYYHFISYCTFLVQNFDLRFTILYILKYIINRILICVSYGYYKSFFRGCLYILIRFNELRRQGKRLKREIQEIYNYGNIAFIDRAYFPNFK